MHRLFTGEYLFGVPKATIIRILNLCFHSTDEWSKDLKGPMFVLCKHKYFQSHAGSTIEQIHYAGPETDLKHSVWGYLKGEGNTCTGVREAGAKGASPHQPAVSDQSCIPLAHCESQLKAALGSLVPTPQQQEALMQRDVVFPPLLAKSKFV